MMSDLIPTSDLEFANQLLDTYVDLLRQVQRSGGMQRRAVMPRPARRRRRPSREQMRAAVECRAPSAGGTVTTAAEASRGH